jgi:hypothetical protein
MVANTSKSNITGEWLLDRRWLWVILAGLLVLTFQIWKVQPFLHGFDRRFWLDGLVYAAVLPASAGLVLSLLSARSREMAWEAGCHHLQPRLQSRLNGAQTYDELAEVLLEFFRLRAAAGERRVVGLRPPRSHLSSHSNLVSKG